MVRLFLRFASFVNSVTLAVCIALFAISSASTLMTVILRYVFSSGFLWLQDLAIYAFGLLAILSLPCALRADRHVRVDIFRQTQSENTIRHIDAVAIMLFLAPVFALLLINSFGDALTSVFIREGSPQIGGMPFYFIVKAGVPLGALLMVIQGLAQLIERHIDTQADTQ